MTTLASINSFNHYRRREPISGLSNKIGSWGFDYYRRGEPLATIVMAGTSPLNLNVTQGQSVGTPRLINKTLIA